MSKTRKILIFVVLIAIIGLLGFGYFSISDYSVRLKENNSKEPEENVEEEEKETQESVSYEKELSDKLIAIGEDIYNNREYKIDLYLSDNGAYFITMEQLRDSFQYDISTFVGEDGIACDYHLSGIFIDPDHKMNVEYIKYNVPVVPVFAGCLSA